MLILAADFTLQEVNALIQNISRKQLYINTVKDYLKSKRISYNEYESSTGSYYFHLDLQNNSHPCIRISDHYSTSATTHCLTLIYTKGLNTKSAKVKQRIIKTLDNTIKRSKTYSLHKELEKLNG